MTPTENEMHEQIAIPSKIAIRNQDVLWRYLEDQPVDEIAEYYGVQPSTIYSILQIPRIQEQLVEWQKKIEMDVSTRMEVMCSEAMEEIRSQMRSDKTSASAKRECVKMILDRAAPFQKKEEVLQKGLWELMIGRITGQTKKEEKDEKSS